MRRLEIVMGLMKRGDIYLLQFRNGDPKIGGAGKIGCFGGKIEADEEPLEAVVREIGEETSLKTTPKMWQLLGEVEVISDHNLEDVEVHATIFLCNLADQTVEALEGELVSFSHAEISDYLDKLTPGTKAVFQKLVLKEN